MPRVHIIPREFDKGLEPQFAHFIKAGFPTPVEDYQNRNRIPVVIVYKTL